MPQQDVISHYYDSVSVDRDRLLDSHIIVHYEQVTRQQVVLDLLSPDPGELILDIGCGNGRDLRTYLKKNVRAVGLDFSLGMLKDAQKEIEREGYGHRTLLSQGDATILPFANNVFTKVACSEVIEHIPGYERIFLDIYRVLKPGGMFVITTPNMHSLYGLYKRFEELWLGIKLRLGKSEQSIEGRLPYDEWKTSKELIRAIEATGLKVNLVRGICYVPSHFTYKFPRFAQRAVVWVTSKFEQEFSKAIPANGYNIAVRGSKS